MIEFGFGVEGDIILFCNALVFGFSISLGLLIASLITSKIIKIIGDYDYGINNT